MSTRVTTQDLQDQMRTDEQGRLICERCGRQVAYGWVYRWGSIVLATCADMRCHPPSPWIKGCTFHP